MSEASGNVIQSKSKLWDEHLYTTWENKRGRKRKRNVLERRNDEQGGEEDMNKLMKEMGLPTSFKSTKKRGNGIVERSPKGEKVCDRIVEWCQEGTKVCDRIVEWYRKGNWKEIERCDEMFHEDCFNAFWEEEGYDIALESWMTKYSKYFSADDGCLNENSKKYSKYFSADDGCLNDSSKNSVEVVEDASKDVDTKAEDLNVVKTSSKSKSDDHSILWEKLWQEHYNNIWNEVHDYFECYGVQMLNGRHHCQESQKLVYRDNQTSCELSTSNYLKCPKYHNCQKYCLETELEEKDGLKKAEETEKKGRKVIVYDDLELDFDEPSEELSVQISTPTCSSTEVLNVTCSSTEILNESSLEKSPGGTDAYGLDESMTPSTATLYLDDMKVVPKKRKNRKKKRKHEPVDRLCCACSRYGKGEPVGGGIEPVDQLCCACSRYGKREPVGGILDKYWCQRYRLFSMFDEGIILDEESWYSVTPERIASHIALRISRYGKNDWIPSIIIDAFCGSGGNTIQFAKFSDHVIAIDIDPAKIQMAKHNAKVYKVEKQIDFILGDYFQVIKSLKRVVDLFQILNRNDDENETDGKVSMNRKSFETGEDETEEEVRRNQKDETERRVRVAVFMSPPWGGPDYLKKEVFDLHDMTPDGLEIIEATREHMTSNIAILLPRNIDQDQLISSAGDGNKIEIEKNILNGKVKTITAYYGDLVQTDDEWKKEQNMDHRSSYEKNVG